MNWSETNAYLKGILKKTDELRNPVRIASFDLDDTIIHRPKARSDNIKWALLDSELKIKISKLIDDNYIIVLFTNQSGMGSRKNFDKPKWRKAVEDLIAILIENTEEDNYYVAVYVAKGHDIYRKPNLGMWRLMKEDLRTEFNLEQIRISKNSFFCGDASGRINPSPYKKKLYPSSKTGDFSDTDIKFAMNIGINFMTPEQFLLTSPPNEKIKLSGINPKKFIEDMSESDQIPLFKPRKKELIMMVGPPGSGKSEFVKKYILPHGYEHINYDTCRDVKKCITTVLDAINEGKSIVIDNTNPNIEARHKYISLAIDNKYTRIRAIIMNTGITMAKHMNNVRHVYSKGKIQKIIDIVYYKYNSSYIRPMNEEHFDKIEEVKFFFDKEKLNDPKWKRAFMLLSEA